MIDRENRARELLAQQYDGTDRESVGNRIRQGKLAPIEKRSIRAMLALADEAASQPREGVVEQIARIIAPRAFRTVQERRSDMDDWVSRIDSRGSAFDAGAEANRLAQDNYDADSADRDDAYAKASRIAALDTAPTDQAQRGEVERFAREHVQAFKEQSNLGCLKDTDARLLTDLFIQAMLVSVAQSGDPS